MSPLDRKLLRDLWRLRGQVLAVAFIVASGVGVLVMSLTSLEGLSETAEAYYERYRFAQVFASAKRAPAPLARRIAALPGVQAVETRINELAIADVPGFDEPVMAQLLSIPERGQPTLNRIALRSGRWVAPGRDDEAILNEPFAEAHGLALGDEISVIMKGHKRALRVVGTALSPEFVYAIGPGALMPDDQRFGVMWIGQETLEAAFDLDGAFNDVTLSLLRGVDPAEVIHRLDLLLDRYGGIGAIARKNQISNWFLTNELDNLQRMAAILPSVFLAVAAFLTNTVLARLIAIERGEIGVLKAFGYGNLEIGWHYAKLALAMAGLGVAIGWGLGYWLGQVNTAIYAELYRFPFLYFRPGPQSFLIAGAVSLAVALLGALIAVRGAVALSPAEAMRPPSPPGFQKAGGPLAWLIGWLDQPTRMILRQVFRWPLRSGLTVIGIGLAVAVLVMAMQWPDSIDEMIDANFYRAMHQDVTVALTDPQGRDVTRDFLALPGVMTSEPSRGVSAIFRSGTREHRGSLEGVLPEAWLELVYDVSGRIVRVPPDGVVLSERLAEKLAVKRGDRVRIEVLEGRRPRVEVTVAEVFDTYLGTPAYMNLEALNRLMKEPHRVAEVALLVDRSLRPALFAELKEIPAISAVWLRQGSVDTFRDTIGENLMVFVSFFVGFACVLAFGVVYNAARIALSERGRELATLRVLGFTRWEISYFLLGETALLALAALPVGCLLGYGLAWVVVESMASELFRVPFVIQPSTFGWSAAIALVAAVISGLVVRRRLDRLDLIAVLKTRE